MPPRPKVFLSHTIEFSDYPKDKSYVAFAKEAVEKFQYYCSEMKSFNAQSDTPQDFDAIQVKECDVYIALLGMRYGTIFSGGISHTEHEYNTAFEHNKRIYVFILDETSVDHKIPVNMLNSGETHRHQEKFKNKIKINHVVKLFKNTENLYNLISDALRELEQTPPDWNWPKPWDFGPYRAERCRGFYGRKWLFEKVQNWAQNPSAERALLLTSDYGVGKTAFLAKLITDQLSGLPLAAEHFCQGGINDTLSPGVFVRSVAAQLASSLPSYRLLLQERDASDLRKLLDIAAQKPVEAWDQAVVALLHRIPTPETHHLLVVDALDVALGHRPAAGEETKVTIVSLLSRNTTPPPWLRVLATSRKTNDVINELKTSFKHDDKLLIDEDSKNIKDLQDHAVNRCSKEKLISKLSVAGLEPLQVAEYLSKYDKSSGKFLYVESMLKALEEELIPLKDINDIRDLPPGMDGFYNLAFESGYPEVKTYEPTRQVLGIMCEAREPFGYKELANIIGCKQKDIPIVLKPLETLLRRRPTKKDSQGKSSGDILVSFEHVSLPQWLNGDTDEYNLHEENKYIVDRDEAKKKIREWILTEVDKAKAHTWSNLTRHLISYLNEEDHSEIIPKLLRSFEWIQARLENTSINTLLSDFKLLEVSDAVHKPAHMMLKRALGQSEQILRNYYNQLPSQLLARLDQYNYPNEITSIAESARKKAGSTGQAIPLTPSLFNPQLLRWNSIPIPYNSKKANADKKVTCLELSSDNEFVFFGLNDGSVCSWDLSTGIHFWRSDESEEKAHKGEVSAIVELPEFRIATASWDFRIILWKRDNLNIIDTLEGHTGIINDLIAISHLSGLYLVSASDDQKLGIWNISTQKNFLIDYSKQNSEIIIVQLSHLDDTKFTTFSNVGHVEVWDIIEKKKLTDKNPGNNTENFMDYSKDLHSKCTFKDGSVCYSLKSNPIIYRTNHGETSANEIGYHDSPIHCLALSRDNSSLASASIKKGADDEYLLKVSIWDPVIEFSSILQPHRTCVGWLITADDQKLIYSFALDGSVCIFDFDEPGLVKSRFNLNDFSESDIIQDFCCFNLGDSRLVVRKGSGLLLYSFPFSTSSISSSNRYSSQKFEKYEQLRPDYVPIVVVNNSKYGLIFGCKDGSIIYEKLGAHGLNIEKFTAVKDGSVDYLAEINEDELLYWTTSPSMDEVFLICNLNKEDDEPYKISSFSIRNIDDQNQHHGKNSTLNILRPLRVWVEDRCIALSQTDFAVSIWKWNDDGTTELTLINELKGHKSIVTDCQQLANGNYITISHDKTVRVWQKNGNKNRSLLDSIIFMGDFPFTALYLSTKANHVIIGDEMGNVHWLDFNIN